MATNHSHRTPEHGQVAHGGANQPARPVPAGGRGPGGGFMGGHGPAAATAARSKDFKGSGRRLLGLLAPHRIRIALIVGLAVVSVTLSSVGPWIMGRATNILFSGAISQGLPAGATQQQVIDGLRAQGQTQLADMLSGMTLTPGVGIDFGALGTILLWLAVIYAFSAVFGWAQQYLTVGVSQGIVYKLRNDVDMKLTKLPLRYFDDHPRGDILSRVTNDIDNIAQTLQQAFTQITTSVLTVIGVLVMMFWINPLLAAVSLLSVPASVFVTLQIAKRSQKHFAAQWEHTGTLNGHIEETHTGRTVVKTFGRQAQAQAEFDEHNEKLYQAAFKAQFISGIIQPAMQFISNLNYVIIAVIGGLKVANGTLTLGDVQAFIQYSRQFTWPITQLASIVNVMQSAVASAERVFELLDEAEQTPDHVPAHDLDHAQGHIVFTDVAFRYRADEPLIDGLSLEAKPGQTIAIVGPTGAGKTTLVNLLMRFYEIDGGTITIDGVDIARMSREGVRRLFGMVLQDAWLFGGTIRENIAYGRDGASEPQIVAAAEAAHVDHFVRTLPDGYDTSLDDDATNLSQGEKQLLTIARAFLADPQVLILDEATSSVDTRTEMLIQQAMERLMEGRTSFVIAHRLSTIRDADLIVVIDHGRIVETGTHDELIAAQGFYADLYESQFSEALDEAS